MGYKWWSLVHYSLSDIKGILPKGPYLPCVSMAVGPFWQDIINVFQIELKGVMGPLFWHKAQATKPVHICGQGSWYGLSIMKIGPLVSEIPPGECLGPFPCLFGVAYGQLIVVWGQNDQNRECLWNQSLKRFSVTMFSSKVITKIWPGQDFIGKKKELRQTQIIYIYIYIYHFHRNHWFET